MSVQSSFTLTETRSEASVARTIYRSFPPTGVYNEGLFTVLGTDLSQKIADQWQWLLGADAQPLVQTAFGDIIFRSERHSAVFFIEVQRRKSSKIDEEMSFDCNVFLQNAGIREKLLREGLAKELSSRLGSLEYGRCYIAEPWESVGGSGAASTFERGDVVVYNSLAAQSSHRILDTRR